MKYAPSTPPDALLAAISKDLEPVKPAPLPSRLAVRLVPFAVAISSLILLIGIRKDAAVLGPVLTWGASITPIWFGDYAHVDCGPREHARPTVADESCVAGDGSNRARCRRRFVVDVRRKSISEAAARFPACDGARMWHRGHRCRDVACCLVHLFLPELFGSSARPCRSSLRRWRWCGRERGVAACLSAIHSGARHRGTRVRHCSDGLDWCFRRASDFETGAVWQVKPSDVIAISEYTIISVTSFEPEDWSWAGLQ